MATVTICVPIGEAQVWQLPIKLILSASQSPLNLPCRTQTPSAQGPRLPPPLKVTKAVAQNTLDYFGDKSGIGFGALKITSLQKKIVL